VLLRVAVIVLHMCAFGQMAAAEESGPKQSVYLFGGAYTTGTIDQSLWPIRAERWEGTFILAAAYQRRFFDLGLGFRLDGEIGLGARFGDGLSGEVWGGPALSHSGLRLGPLNVAPGIVTGFSVISGPMGIERARSGKADGDSHLLFYLGPEIAFRHERLPNVEFVFRTHHRSGLYGTLGDMDEGHNANVFGVRVSF
jgi:hypothetical protein